MDGRLARLLDDGGGVVRRQDALSLVTRQVFDGAARSGALRRVHSGTYVDARRREDREVLSAAALAYAGPGAALSHLTGLRTERSRCSGRP